jgi:hypothetical protein
MTRRLPGKTHYDEYMITAGNREGGRERVLEMVRFG